MRHEQQHAIRRAYVQLWPVLSDDLAGAAAGGASGHGIVRLLLHLDARMLALGFRPLALGLGRERQRDDDQQQNVAHGSIPPARRYPATAGAAMALGAPA